MTKRERIAAIVLGVGALQMFIIQIIAALQWSPPYDWLERTISDLGNTSCGQFAIHGATAYVCSPLHTLMNCSMILLAVTGIVAGILLFSVYRRRRRAAIGITLFIVANICAVFVGLFPEDVNAKLHLIGALSLPLSSIAFLVFWSAIRSERKSLARWILIIGVFGIVGSIGLVVAQGAGSATLLGSLSGLTERLISYPPKIFFMVVAWAAVKRSH